MLPAELTRLFTSVLNTMAAINSWGQRNSVWRSQYREERDGRISWDAAFREIINLQCTILRAEEPVKCNRDVHGTWATVTFRYYSHHVGLLDRCAKLNGLYPYVPQACIWGIATVQGRWIPFREHLTSNNILSNDRYVHLRIQIHFLNIMSNGQ